MADTDSTRSPKGGGFLLMLCILVGTIGGLAMGQPSAGFLLGLAVGIAVAVALWYFDRRQD